MIFLKIIKVLSKFLPVKYKTILYRRVFYEIGPHSKIFTNYIGTEPYLIKIGRNVNVAAGVKFITHDISCENISRLLNNGMKLDSVGCVILKDNAFVGAYSILLPNTIVGTNSIVAAGSVVTKNIADNEVWAGVPAKKIMDIDDYKNKLIEKNKNYNWKQLKGSKLRKARKEYFFNGEIKC